MRKKSNFLESDCENHKSRIANSIIVVLFLNELEKKRFYLDNKIKVEKKKKILS